MSNKASKSILKTLHIRCGHDIEDRLVEAGIEGHYLCFTDPAWLGPPPQFNAWVAGRAQLIAERTGLPRAQVREELGDSYWRLARAPKEYKRIVLWFEHDLYDQAALARVLASFGTRAKLPPVELIQVEGALGELSVEQLLKLWPKRTRVTAAQMAQAKAVWSALCAETPESLTQLVKKGLRDLPFMKAALVRHLQELPWTGDGLSLTERQVLQALVKGPLAVSEIFAAVVKRDPQHFMGDLFFWSVVRDLIDAPVPPVAVSTATRRLGWPKRVLKLTASGKALLEAKADWQATEPLDRWVGGVVVVPGAPAWRWNPRKSEAELAKAA